MLETELEFELEDELEGEEEWEDESELEGELEDEFEMEDEFELEDEYELEDEFEGEEFIGSFLKKAARKVGRFVKKAAPILKAVARKAAPIVGTAIGGPAGGLIARGLSRTLLREGEFEDEFEMEDEFETEDEFELEDEAEGVMTADDAVAEYMAALASKKRAKSDAPAMVGAAAVATLKPSDRAALRKVLPHMVRGTNVLTKILRQRAITRPAVRTVPTIVRRTAKVLKKRAAMGKPVTRAAAGKAMATQVKKVLGNKRRCAAAISRNVKATRAVARRRRTIRG